MFFVDNDQQSKYYQVWKEILKIINGGHDELKLHEKIRPIEPIEHVFKIPSITIVIKSLIEKNNKFYLEISLNHCLYENYFKEHINMLEYNRIDLSEGIDVNKCEDTSRKCNLCHYYYFVFKKFNYQRHICDGCHDISTKAISMQNIAIVYHDGQAHRVNFTFMSRNDAFNLMKKSVIIDKKGTL